jgi:hypothetical protein
MGILAAINGKMQRCPHSVQRCQHVVHVATTTNAYGGAYVAEKREAHGKVGAVASTGKGKGRHGNGGLLTQRPEDSLTWGSVGLIFG